ncbi:MAG: hypothetical protein ACFCVE_09220 [Phycisphaerae bacterium]
MHTVRIRLAKRRIARFKCTALAVAPVLLLAATLPGCQADGDNGQAVQVQAGPELDSFRNSLQDQNPNYRIGFVNETLPELPFASVGRIPVSDFKGGELITFLDPGTRQSIATGEVIRVEDDALYVEFEPYPGTLGRRPVPGDWAYHLID